MSTLGAFIIVFVALVAARIVWIIAGKIDGAGK